MQCGCSCTAARRFVTELRWERKRPDRQLRSIGSTCRGWGPLREEKDGKTARRHPFDHISIFGFPDCVAEFFGRADFMRSAMSACEMAKLVRSTGLASGVRSAAASSQARSSCRRSRRNAARRNASRQTAGAGDRLSRAQPVRVAREQRIGSRHLRDHFLGGD